MAALSIFWWVRETHLLRIGSGFFFARTLVHQPSYTVFYRHGRLEDHICQGSPPLVGYLHYTHVNGGRNERFKACPDPSGRSNKIGARIGRKRLAQIKPKDWTEDPYFVCLLLALAQLQERKLKSSEPLTYTSRLFVTNVLEREYVYLYDADITTELLKTLREPKAATTCIKWPTIRRRKLRFKPYDTCQRTQY
ncbi:uncharacterized protein LDX57_011777 [Aspergillus melleus]|uniref:uncharacterized protein n=1 Tax=Aspergillus melleus TaxID=138277 RepID=UPI001E8D2DB0|nr:uncharacterized protein LDX57_011777 [Aspergillus melleus]KAH8434139.1 hypothetical protein LDX57_011777 [Aspergillus melleus]